MGTIYRDSRGKLVMNYVDLHGRRQRKAAGTDNMKEARSALAALETEVHRAKVLRLASTEQLRPVRFEEFVEKTYLPAMAPPTRRESSHTRDQFSFLHVKEVLGDRVLSSIGAGDIEKYLAARKLEKTFKGTLPAPATLNRERQFIGAVLAMALRHELIERNPVQIIPKAKEDNQKDRALMPDQLRDVLDRCPAWLSPIVHLGAETGMRLSEISGLKWAQVDRKDGEAVLDGWIRLAAADTKGRSDRKVPITPAVKSILDSQFPVKGPSGFVPWVFVNAVPRSWKKKGQLPVPAPYLSTSISNAFKEAARRAGVTASFHSLRHTAVSRLAAHGVPDRIIMAIIGHSTAALVGRYTHVRPEDVLREVKRVRNVSISSASQSGS